MAAWRWSRERFNAAATELAEMAISDWVLVEQSIEQGEANAWRRKDMYLKCRTQIVADNTGADSGERVADDCAEISALLGEENLEVFDAQEAPNEPRMNLLTSTESIDSDSSHPVDHIAQVVSIEAHVVFSSSFEMPVLYFSATRLDSGEVLDVSQLARVLVSNRCKFNVDIFHSSAWLLREDAVSQGIHPVLGTVWHFIHPCQSAALLAEVSGLHDDTNIVASTTTLREGCASIGDKEEQAGGAASLLLWLSVYGGALGLHVLPEWVVAARRNGGKSRTP